MLDAFAQTRNLQLHRRALFLQLFEPPEATRRDEQHRSANQANREHCGRQEPLDGCAALARLSVRRKRSRHAASGFGHEIENTEVRGCGAKQVLLSLRRKHPRISIPGVPELETSRYLSRASDLPAPRSEASTECSFRTVRIARDLAETSLLSNAPSQLRDSFTSRRSRIARTPISQTFHTWPPPP